MAVRIPENLQIHLNRGDELVYLSRAIKTPRQYFEEEKSLAEFLCRQFPHFRRFRAVGVAQGWIRDEEFTPHIRFDLEQGLTPHLGAVHGWDRASQEIMYLKTVLPDDQVARMSRSQRMQSAWGTDASHRSPRDILLSFLSMFTDEKKDDGRGRR